MELILKVLIYARLIQENMLKIFTGMNIKILYKI